MVRNKMTVYSRTLFATIACVAVLISFGCSGRASRVHAPAIDAVAAGKAAMEQYDTDKDGKVSGGELEAAASLQAALKNLDTNGDSAVSADEVTARIQAWQDSKIGLLPVACIITFRGEPLVGATVVFEPEAFLGETLKACEGKTNQQGRANLRIPDSERKLPGGAPGLYKIKITSPNAQIPEKYNTQTVLGAEVANDSATAKSGVILSLH